MKEERNTIEVVGKDVQNDSKVDLAFIWIDASLDETNVLIAYNSKKSIFGSIGQKILQ